MLVNTSDDAWLYEGKNDELDVDTAERQRTATIQQGKQSVEVDDAVYEDVTGKTEDAASAQTGGEQPAQTTEDDGPGY